MLNRVKILLDRNLISINPCFDKLILALQTATEENGRLIKAQMQHDDAFDSFRLSLGNYQDYDSHTKRPVVLDDWSDVY